MITDNRKKLVVEYLQQNKNKIKDESSFGDFINLLRKSGYTEEEIQYGVDVVYYKNNENKEFIKLDNNIRENNNHYLENKLSRKARRKEILFGMLIGLGLMLLEIILIVLVAPISLGLLLILYIMLIIYFAGKRIWVSLGLIIMTIIIPLVASGSCFI